MLPEHYKNWCHGSCSEPKKNLSSSVCNSCGGPSIYAPELYQGGYYCPSPTCPAGQVLETKDV